MFLRIQNINHTKHTKNTLPKEHAHTNNTSNLKTRFCFVCRKLDKYVSNDRCVQKQNNQNWRNDDKRKKVFYPYTRLTFELFHNFS